MFDIGFSELLVIAVVALVVIGPERLPGVARTIGHLLGRFQRYVGDVKSDIKREMHLEELKKIRADIEQQAGEIERSVVTELRSAEQSVVGEVQSLGDVMTATGQEPGPVASTTLGDFDPLELPPQKLPPAAGPQAAVVVPTPVAPTSVPSSPRHDAAA